MLFHSHLVSRNLSIFAEGYGVTNLMCLMVSEFTAGTRRGALKNKAVYPQSRCSILIFELVPILMGSLMWTSVH